MTNQGIRKPKQYTIKGIKMGRFDEDLDRLLRTVQRRRADIGQIKVIRVGPGGTFTPEEPPENVEAVNVTPERGGSSTGYAPTYTWPFNQDKLPANKLDVLDFLYAHRQDDEASQAPLVRYNYNASGSVNVGEYNFLKAQLTGRIVALHDQAAAETGVAVMFVESIARRNLTGYPLLVSRLASTRKYNSTRNKASRGETFSVPPESLADVYIDSDPLKGIVNKGETGVYPN